MKYKILMPNEDGKFEFTKEELESLLEETYNEGLEEGKKWSITTPSINPLPYPYNPLQPYVTWTGSGTGDVPTYTTSVWMTANGNYVTNENLQGSV